MKVQVVGITGVICSGKSLISQYLKKQGYKVFDADEEVQKLYKDRKFLKILKSFFPHIFINGKINKTLLSNVVFKNKKKLKKLEQIIHPIIEKKCNEFIAKNQKEKIIFLDVPLLFEVKWDKKCDHTIAISVNNKIQKKRFLANGKTEKELESIRQNQLLNDEKVARATFVVDNNGTKADTYKQIDWIIQKLL